MFSVFVQRTRTSKSTKQVKNMFFVSLFMFFAILMQWAFSEDFDALILSRYTARSIWMDDCHLICNLFDSFSKQCNSESAIIIICYILIEIELSVN